MEDAERLGQLIRGHAARAPEFKEAERRAEARGALASAKRLKDRLHDIIDVHQFEGITVPSIDGRWRLIVVERGN